MKLRSRGRIFAPLLLPLLDACPMGPTGTMDGPPPAPDLSMGGGGDMAMGLTGLPTCLPSVVDSTMLFDQVVNPHCSKASCHGSMNSALFSATSAAMMKSAWVNQPSSQTTQVPRVRPNNVQQSYVMYKIMGQHQKVGGTGSRMPDGASMLPDGDICKFIQWIQGGAN